MSEILTTTGTTVAIHTDEEQNRAYTWSGAGWCSCTPRVGLERGHGMPTLAELCKRRNGTIVDWTETPDV